MEIGKLLGRGMAFPPHVKSDGRIAWSEGEVNIRESIQIILQTELGERLRLPDFGGGLGTYLFEPNTTTTRHLIEERIKNALRQWERRIIVESVSAKADTEDPQTAIVSIVYKLVTTQVLERLNLRFTFGS